MTFSLLKLLRVSIPPIVDDSSSPLEKEGGLESIDSESTLPVDNLLLADCTGFDDLPEHLLEQIFGYLGCSNRRNHFSVCAVSRSWRRIGQRMFFSRPWEVPHIICHPNQLFFLSPRLPMGSRSGLLKCFVVREPPSKGGSRKFKLFLGKDPQQPHRARFLLCALQLSRQRVEFYLNSACQGEPCGVLTANAFASKYTLNLADSVELVPEPSHASGDASSSPTRGSGSHQAGSHASMSPSGGSVPPGEFSWGEVATKLPCPETTLITGEAPRVLAQLQYRARVKGLMQPRRMHVVLPNTRQLACRDSLPQLSRTLTNSSSMGGSTAGSAAAARAEAAVAASSTPRSPATASSPISRQPSLNKPSAVAALERPSDAQCMRYGLESSAMPRNDVDIDPIDVDEEGPSTSHGGALGSNAAPAPVVPLASGEEEEDTEVTSSTNSMLHKLLGPCAGRGAGGLLQHKTVPIDEMLQPMCLKNKAPHWNEGLRCWCLNFRGRVKLASVKNFQLVREDDSREKVVMQFGKVDKDAYVLDFNPTVLTAVQALAISLSTFNPKVLL